MNWGWRIAIFYGTFVVFMIGMVVMSFRQDFDLWLTIITNRKSPIKVGLTS